MAGSEDRRGWALRAVSVLSGCAGLAYVIWLLVDSTDDFDDGLVPAVGVLVVAVLARLVSLSAAGVGFLLVHHPDDRGHRVVRGYAVSQLAKYLPGGIWQPASQISIVSGGTTTVWRAAAAYVWGMVLLVSAAAALASGIAVLPEPPLPTAARVAAVAGLAGLLVLVPAVPRTAARLVDRLRGKDHAPLAPPPPRRLHAAMAAFAVSVTVDAAAFALLLRDLQPSVGWALAMSAFAAAWTLGVLAVPVPSGIGVREAVLVGVLATAATAAPVLAASLAARLASMLAELAFAGATTAASYRHGRRSTAGPHDGAARSAGSSG